MNTVLPLVTLVLGGARSGKSRYAEELIESQGKGLYLATAQPTDAEMRSRISEHRLRRGEAWETIEEPHHIVEVISREARPHRPILVDCLTLWLSHVLFHEKGADKEIARLKGLLESGALRGPVVFVSNEIGLGVIPDNKVSRVFVDAQGELNQLVANLTNRVVLVTAGLPQILREKNDE